MTALAATNAPAATAEAPLASLPWRRMGWVVWRQHRIALAGVAVVLGALAVAMWLAGIQLHHAYAAAISGCRDPRALACPSLIDAFDGTNGFLANGFILQVVPPLVGAFMGATVLARELETGTFRYAWTQAFGRWRWTIAKLVTLGLVLAAGAGALGVVFSWYFRPYFASVNEAQLQPLSTSSPMAPGLFDLRPLTFAAWTLTAFALGGLAGVLIRRVVPAIAATLAAYAALAFLAGGILRERYLSPIVAHTLSVPGTAWILGQWGTKDGQVAFTGNLPDSVLSRYCNFQVAAGKPKVQSLYECVSRHGYTLWSSYQPATRFWPFQWIETGWLVALSGLLIAVTVWLVNRRPA
jgi:hypothetical protein